MNWEQRRELRSSAPSSGGLRRLGQVLGRISGVKELPGGVATSVHAFNAREDDGSLSPYVLKRFIASDLMPPFEWEGLELAQAAVVPTPVPDLIDQAGDWFGMPALVMSRLPGTSTYRIGDLAIWTDALAAALVAIHAAPVPFEVPAMLFRPAYLADWIPAADNRDGRLAAVGEVLTRLRVLAAGEVAVFSHGDYHPQNVLWEGDHISGVIDWSGARFVPRGLDVATCRTSLALSPGGDAADMFLAAYRRHSGEALANIALWDVLCGIDAFEDGLNWLDGILYVEPAATGAQVVERASAFLDAALAKC